MKSVTRTYYSKKKGEWVTKHYTYTKQYTQKPTSNVGIRKVQMTTKSGKLTAKAQSIFNEWKKDKSIQDIESAEDIIRDYQGKKKTLTIKQIDAMVSGNRLQLMLANFGISIDTIYNYIVKELKKDTTIEWLLDNAHWDFKNEILTLKDGTKLGFVFKYTTHEYYIREI